MEHAVGEGPVPLRCWTAEAGPAAGADEAPAAGEAPAVGADAGRLVESSHADDRRMIALVRARPLLYTRSSMPVASYYAKTKRLWQEVADIMGWTVSEVRRKWSHIRNSYSRHLRNVSVGARTGRGRAVSRWYLAAELDFLRAHMATDTRTGASPPPGERADRDRDRDEDEPYFHFFKGLYCDYRELPPDKQRLFRRQCVLLLHELVEGEAGAGWGGGWGAGEEGAEALVSVKLEPPDAADTDT